MVKTALEALAGVALTGLLGYLGVRRVGSGKIGTSEAKDLWAESQSMRRELRDEVSSLRIQLGEAHKEADRLRNRVIELEGKVQDLSSRVDAA